MNRAFPVLLLVFAAAWSGCNGSSAPPPPAEPSASPAAAAAPAEDTRATITGLEKEWVNAILNKDQAAIERLLAPDFIGTTNDLRYTRDDAIIDVKTGEHQALDVSGLEVHVFGDTAVATFDQEERSHHGKEDFSGRYLFTNVWVKENGGWHAVASHGARVR